MVTTPPLSFGSKGSGAAGAQTRIFAFGLLA